MNRSDEGADQCRVIGTDPVHDGGDAFTKTFGPLHELVADCAGELSADDDMSDAWVAGELAESPRGAFLCDDRVTPFHKRRPHGLACRVASDEDKNGFFIRCVVLWRLVL